MWSASHLLAPGRPLRALIEGDRLSSVIFEARRNRKTSLSRLIASTTEKVFVELSAVTASVKDVREEIASARHRLGNGTGTILFLDEVHRFNKAQQDTLLPAVEEGLIVLIGPTTETRLEVNPPLMSRSTLFRLHASTRPTSPNSSDGLSRSKGRAPTPTLSSISPAGRAATAVMRSPAPRSPSPCRSPRASDPCHARRCRGSRRRQGDHYGRDGHFDIIGTFIKSIRGWTPTLPCTGSPACSSGRDFAVAVATPSRTSVWPTHKRCSSRPQRHRRSSSSVCPRPSSIWPRRRSSRPHRSRTGHPGDLRGQGCRS